MSTPTLVAFRFMAAWDAACDAEGELPDPPEGAIQEEYLEEGLQIIVLPDESILVGDDDWGQADGWRAYRTLAEAIEEELG